MCKTQGASYAYRRAPEQTSDIYLNICLSLYFQRDTSVSSPRMDYLPNFGGDTSVFIFAISGLCHRNFFFVVPRSRRQDQN